MVSEILMQLMILLVGKNFQIDVNQSERELNILIKSIGEKKISAGDALKVISVVSELLRVVCVDSRALDLWLCLDKKLSDFDNFSSKIEDYFKRKNLVYLGELALINSDSLKNEHNFGDKSVKDLKAFLKEYGLSFNMDREKDFYGWQTPNMR